MPVERNRDDLAPYLVVGNGPGTPEVNPGRDVAEFSWPRIQQDASVLGIPLWITAGREVPLGRAALRLEVLCEEIGGAQPGHLEVEIVDAPDPA